MPFYGIYDAHNRYPANVENLKIDHNRLQPGDVVMVEFKITRWNKNKESGDESDAAPWIDWRVGLDLVYVSVFQFGEGTFSPPEDNDITFI